jgi:transcriptional regulator with XRE-family HTH domain
MTTESFTTFGDRLRRSRKRAELTPEQMADLLVCRPNAISAWENDRARPADHKLRRWAEIVAERTAYDVEGLLKILDPEMAKPVTKINERRRNERRTQQKRKFAWIDRAELHNRRAEILTLVERRQPEVARRLAS